MMHTADAKQSRATWTERSSKSAYVPKRGLSVPSITVIDPTGRIVEEEQRRVFRFNVQQGYGANIIFGIGTNGEWNRLTNDQRQELIEIETDEVRRINEDLLAEDKSPVEAWVGVTSATKHEVLANLECAIENRADAAVIAPLSIGDLGDLIEFFQRDITDLLDRAGVEIPIFLYDNADIAVDPNVPHLRTRDVKRLSRLPFIKGIKVSAPRRVLGNYTKAALNFKDSGEFGIYIGDAMLMFEVYKLQDGLIGKFREYWNRYLLHNELPIGVVSGPANPLPREWQRAWRACYTGDEKLIEQYQSIFSAYGAAYSFEYNGQITSKLIACLKYSLKLEEVIEHDGVANGTLALSEREKTMFRERYARIKDQIGATNPMWISRV
ncbi:MAG TPA: dihydrodipicolinate synthase family protein [Blastocatellia bacterium]|nr:dihydrodipicolinate synthase family protein [Blastocatellia bacterium]